MANDYENFKGRIKLDIRHSVPDWSAFTAKPAPEGAPIVLVVLYDDTGDCGDNESYGTATLWIDENGADSKEIRTATGHYALCGEGLCIGAYVDVERHFAAAMSWD